MDAYIKLFILFLGIVAIILMSGKGRIHAFLALLSVSIVMGIAFGLAPEKIIKDVVEGFGGTLGFIGLITFSATIIGELMAKTGATVVISESIMKIMGKDRSPLALGMAGYLLAPPVSCNDTAFIILSPIAKALGSAKGYSHQFLSLILAAGAYSSFKLVFPAAPLYSASIFDANMAQVIVFGFLLSVPVFISGILWAEIYMRFRKEGIEDENPTTSIHQSARQDKLPSLMESYGMIILPMILIVGRAIADRYVSKSNEFRVLLDFVGHPVIAMLIGVMLALLVARNNPKENVSQWVNDGIKRASSIVAIVGGGGVLGKILMDADLGGALATSVSNLGVSGALTVFIVAAIIKTAQGSSMITMITAPSILLPILPSLGISPTFATLLVCSGAMISVHINDSYFWVVTGFSEMSVKEGLKGLTVMSIIQGLVAFIFVMAIKSFFPYI